MMSWNWSFYSTSLAADSWLASARSLSRTATMEERVRVLDDHLRHLTVLTRAIWELSRDRLQLSEDDLLERAKEIAVRVENADAPSHRPCPKCGRQVSTVADRCLYCGTEIQHSTAFEKI